MNDPEGALLLRCAAAALPNAESAVREVDAERIRWNRFLELAKVHGMVPLLARRVLGPDAGFPDEAAAALAARARTRAYRSMSLARALVDVLSALEAAGVASLPYKGPALATSAYGDVSLRPFSDLDVVVAWSDVPVAVDSLRELGFEPTGRLSAEAIARCGGYHLSFRRERDGVIVELHWHFDAPELRPPLSVDELIAEADSVSIAGTAVPALPADTRAVLLCAHGAKHQWQRLEWLCSLACLLDGRSESDLARILRLSATLGCQRRVLLGLHLVETVLRRPLPAVVGDAIAADPEVARLAARARPNLTGFPHDPDPIEALSFRFRTPDSLPDRLRAFFRFLTIPRAADVEALPPQLRPLCPIVRPARLAGKFAAYSIRRIATR